MTNIRRRVVSAAAAGAMLLSTAGPAFAAATTIEISGNGAFTDNYATVEQENETKVVQDNDANVVNKVNSSADTGNNDAKFNTGGDVTVKTGAAETKTDISNVLNTNSAEVDCCDQGDTNVKIQDNGAFSDNIVALEKKTETKVYQDNYANVYNDVDANANTGGNDANLNTGGDVTIMTGKAKTDTSISTLANVNSAVVSSGPGSSNPSASFVISGNGAFSDNFIAAELEKETKISQDNSAHISNKVDANANSGYNDADFNTGGDVVIDTGAATVLATVDNAVNFNHADVDCGCVWDVLAKIADNGAKSDSTIAAALESEQEFYQDNYSRLYNDVEGDAKTGKNDANLNTGESDGDPSITTGAALSDTIIENSGNVNSVGSALPYEWPEHTSNVEFSFNFAALMAFFGMSV